MVITYILAILVVLLKAIGVVLAAVVALILLAVSLPVKARVSGSASASGLLEGVLDDEAATVPLDLDFSVDASFLAGAAGFSMGGGGNPEVKVLGLRFRRRGKKQASGRTATDGGKREGRQAGKVLRSVVASTKKAAKKGTKGGISIRQIRQYISPEVREKTWTAVRSLFSALRLRGSLDVACGLPDPGSTGLILAAYSALGGLSRFEGITFRPIFWGEEFDVRGTGELRLIPVEIGWIVAWYLLSREIRPLWRKVKRGRIRRAEADRSVGAVSAD